MKRYIPWLVILAVLMGLATSCSGSGAVLTPDIPQKPGVQNSNEPISQTQLWGLYTVYVDIPSQTATGVLDRQAMFTANVVQFVNGKASNLGFHINKTPVTPDYVDVDIDVTISHPFPGLTQYNGYDVRGVFMGDGSASLLYNPDLICAMNGTDQFMFPDPEDSIGGPDGYTRWFNKPEFSTGGMPLFQYTQGKVASPGFDGTATLNPYKYFADSLGANDDLMVWLGDNSEDHGVFRSGVSNTRNYYLRFPNAKGVKFGYAIIANWGGTEPENHPSNAPEAVAASVDDGQSTVYYTDPTDKGGDMVLDFSLWNWESQPSTIFIESTVLSSPSMFDPSTILTGGGDNYSTYHVEIPADNVQGLTGNEYWVIAEYAERNYQNDFGTTNLAEDDLLAALFRYDLNVLGETPCNDWTPVVSTLNGLANYNAVTKPYTGWTIAGSSFEDGSPGVAVNDGVSDVAVATNVQWVDANTITFDIDLTGLPIGTYDIVVTNGCGDKLKGTGVDMLTLLKWIHVTGTPNIDVATGYGTPKDIAIDPSSDQVGVSYATSWVNWTSNYTSHSAVHSSWSGRTMGYWDGTTSFIWYCHDYYGTNGHFPCWTWANWTGYQSSQSYWQPYENDMKDIANLQGTTQLWGVFDWKNGSGGPYCCFMPSLGDGNFNYNFAIAPFYDGAGDNGVVLDNLMGIDFPIYSGSGIPEIYMLEAIPSGNTGVVERWAPVASGQPGFKLAFGEGLLYDPLDITVDSNDYVYVLEKNSDGDPVIWAWDVSGNLIGTSEPLTSTEISGNPLRIDASLSVSPDEVHVLHSLGVTRFVM